MKNYLIIFVLLFSSFSGFSQEEGEEVTTYYLIRHAEKDDSDATNTNPDLNQTGLDRAKNWAKVFAPVNLDAVYSTDFRRTKQTAKPTADSKKLPTYAFDTTRMYDSGFKYNTSGKSVLIVGHSDTTPQLANIMLGEEKYPTIEENNSGNLYIVTVTKNKTTCVLLKID
ncbi:SixA phosphatase family protein [Tenacibaculum adriaticum]|nr:histidine phosphatase family protein [Tenacibaculum adriaticum]